MSPDEDIALLDPNGAYTLTVLSNKTNISQLEGTSWVLSSAKPRFGVTQLLSHDLDSLWQSDGAQPHTATIHLPKRTAITVRW